MNVFVEHGAALAPKWIPRKNPEYTATPVEQRMEERQRLSRAYRRRKRQHVREILAGEPRLRDFLRYLNKVGPEDGGELIDALDACAWLRAAPQDVRLFALGMVNARCDKLNQSLGFEALDDPLPPESSTYFRARDILHAEGRQ